MPRSGSCGGVGARVCGGEQDVADAVDETLVQDANDTDQQLTRSLIDGVVR